MKQVESEKIEKKQIDLSKELEERQIRVKKKDYIVTLYERGCNILSDGDCERQIFPNKCYVVCSLEEILFPKLISMGELGGCPSLTKFYDIGTIKRLENFKTSINSSIK